MTAPRVLLDALSDEPTSTSDLYDRVGYPALVSAGLVPYDAFRAELVKLSTAGLAERGTDEDGAGRSSRGSCSRRSVVWR
jgi:hypothetical protein